ncbi:unnamed protein product [Schistosoma mattheei]|uniref:Uncharacterized protein n=1 Tax=Schistosoma mattheei TaxID=31246 RepID=A0A183PSB5_9TREM|nr:unnamed protein product [Schistosoma mattheei]
MFLEYLGDFPLFMLYQSIAHSLNKLWLYLDIEVYDGHDGHPVVRRANSRPPGIPIQAVLNTIHDFAFIRSE